MKNNSACQIRSAKIPPAERLAGFSEASLGYTEEEALSEAGRCLLCRNPSCVSGCPVGINIPGFIEKLRKKDYLASAEILRDKNSLPAVCGRVCPQENQCEKSCILTGKMEPVGIGKLERFIADYSDPVIPPLPPRQDKKVAVIGSGPAGLTCAGDLARAGLDVTLFESLSSPGGVLLYGIPEFRLPKRVIRKEIEYIRGLGVKIVCNFIIGLTKTLDDLRREGYKAFFIGTGAGLPWFLDIPGENLNGVYTANEYLTRVNMMNARYFPEYDTPVRAGKSVIVVGAGNVAVDAARVARRLGAGKVSILYRRGMEEIPARKEEVENAQEEGIEFVLLSAPKRIFGDSSGNVSGMECKKTGLGAPDATGRRRPVILENSGFSLSCDGVIIAIGQHPNPLLIRTLPGIELDDEGAIKTDYNDGSTSIPDVFAGGDISTGSATVIEAMGAGKRAARSIIELHS